MNYERVDNNKSLQDLFNESKNLMDYHIIIMMKDGSSVDGIIEKVDSNGIIILVGEDVLNEENGDMQQSMKRQFGHPGISRFRRFKRRAYPFNVMRTLFPIIYPYPFYPINPYYPY